jgi:hypothetical protein
VLVERKSESIFRVREHSTVMLLNRYRTKVCVCCSISERGSIFEPRDDLFVSVHVYVYVCVHVRLGVNQRVCVCVCVCGRA